MLTPNVEVLLASYTQLMSSVPGLPFTFDLNVGEDSSLKTESIKVTVDKGEFLTWNIETGKVTQEGMSLSCKAGDTIYWSPGISIDGDEETKQAQITVTAMKEGNEIGKQTISIVAMDGYYYATVGELV